MNLRIPGPTPLPPQVMAALQQPMIDHRGPEFAAMQARVLEGVKRIINTQNDLLPFTSSGTGALEAAVTNVISPGDPVLAFSAGAFGDRLADIARAYGASLTKVDLAWGEAIGPERVASTLRGRRDLRAVLVTHNETSTGILHPLKEIAQAVRNNSDAVLIVDAVSSLGAVEMQTDAWGIDLLATASQKAWMCPPGLSLLSVSPRAWKAHATAKSPHFYFDIGESKKWVEKGQTPFTPAVGIYFALDAALKMMQAEGMPNIYARHARAAQRTRERAPQLGFTLFGDERYASPTVTALTVPQGIDPSALRQVAREEFGLVIAGGQGKLKEKIIRIGHLGFVHVEDIDEAMQALGRALDKLRK